MLLQGVRLRGGPDPTAALPPHGEVLIVSVGGGGGGPPYECDFEACDYVVDQIQPLLYHCMVRF